MDYKVAERVVFEEAGLRGLTRVEFEAGRVSDPSEDERFVLERVLIPRGLAKRYRAKGSKSDDEPKNESSAEGDSADGEKSEEQ